MGADALLRRNLLIWGLGGVIVPFIGIKLIDLLSSEYISWHERSWRGRGQHEGARSGSGQKIKVGDPENTPPLSPYGRGVGVRGRRISGWWLVAGKEATRFP